MPVETHNDIVPATGIEPTDAVETHEDIRLASGVEPHREESPRAHRAYGGAINPIELRDDPEDMARRLILWSYAVAPVVRPLSRAEGGPVDDPVDKALSVAGTSQPNAAQKAVETARSLTPMGFYSAAAEAASKIPQRAPIDQIINKVKGSPGVKAEELDQSGVRDAFAGQKSVDPKEVARHFQENLPQISEKVYGGAPIVHKAEEVEPEHFFGDNVPSWLTASFVVGPRFKPEQQYVIHEAGKTRFRGDTSEYYLKGPRGDDLGDYESLEAAEQAANDAMMKRDPVKYQDYALPGGERYREVTLQLPPTGKGSERGFQSAHWSDPNVLAHLRMSDRTGSQGEKVLHVDEIQSDWAQKGRDEGFYKGPTKQLSGEVVREEGPEDRWRVNWEDGSFSGGYGYEAAARARLNQGKTDEKPGVPVGPHVTDTNSWTDLALKRALKEAAEGGYDKMVWTPGETQADRYNLVHSVKKLAFDPLTKKLFVTPIGKDEAVEAPGVFTKDNLRNFVGKGVAEKLLAADPQHGIHALEGDQLSTSGEGMKNFYDRIVPSRLQALVKKLDPEAKINLFSHDLPAAEGEGTIKGHALHLTPKLREAILKGLPAYEHGGSVLKHAFNVISRYS